MLSNKDIDFLIELQHELKTQEHDCQAEPRYWGVAESRREYGVNSDYGNDGCRIYMTEDYDFSYDEDQFEECKEALIEYEICTAEEIEHIDNMSNLYSYLIVEKDLEDKFDIDYYREDRDHVTQETGCFITKRACERHISLNRHHYKKPHTYAMTAWRNPEFENVLNIVTNTDWESYKEKEKPNIYANLLFTSIFSLALVLVWQILEYIIYGEVQERIVDSIIMIPIMIMIFYNVRYYLYSKKERKHDRGKTKISKL